MQQWAAPAPPPSAAAGSVRPAYYGGAPAMGIGTAGASSSLAVAPAAPPAAAAAAPSLAGVAFLPKDATAQSKAARKSKGAPPTWQCAICTFNNKLSRELCEMCETPNPRANDPPSAASPAPSSSKVTPAPTANGVGGASAAGKKGTAAAAVAALAAAAAAAPAPPPQPAMVPSAVSASFRTLGYENGIVTACNNLTYDEVMRRRLIGLPRANLDLVMKLRAKTSAIFLLNMETRDMYGVFEADGSPGLDIEPEAWSGSSYNGRRTSRFPAQCHFTIAADFESPLAERHYKEFLYGKDKAFLGRIRSLSAEEVKGLIKIFQTKSKLRRVPGPPLAAATATPAGAPSGTSATAAAASAPAAAAAATPQAPAAAASPSTGGSGANSRRNSIDSSVSAEDDGGLGKGKKGKKVVVKTQQTCKRWLADECTFSDENCKFLHVATVCRAFQRSTCPKGQNCPFIHDKVDREHYRQGRSYCQKTAVHEDLKPSPVAAAAVAAAKPKTSAPKDSLDSILSGLGSWKIASKKNEPTQTAPSASAVGAAAAATSAAAAAAVVRDEEAEEDIAALEAAERDEGAVDVDDDALDAAGEFDIGGDGGLSFDAGTSHHAGSVLGAAGAAGGFLDGGLSFDGGHHHPAAASPWAFDAGVGFDGPNASGAGGPGGSGGLDFGGGDGGSMFFAGPGSGGVPGGAEGTGFDQQPEEFAWFSNFRTHVVQPALQAFVQREQQTGQKIIGPD